MYGLGSFLHEFVFSEVSYENTRTTVTNWDLPAKEIRMQMVGLQGAPLASCVAELTEIEDDIEKLRRMYREEYKAAIRSLDKVIAAGSKGDRA
jgi:hypothetical protein